jgi:ABC-type transport system involved in multi-copper enzyme maturation permease subunit
VSLLLRAAFLETMRRREFYVLLLFMGLFLAAVGVVKLVGIENAATATFLLNLGITTAFALAHVLTLLTALRSIAWEMESRTIYPLLAKPVSRAQYFAGKWLTATLAGVLAAGILCILGWLPVPKMEQFHAGMLVQALLLQCISLGMLAALSLLASLFSPMAVNVVFLVALFAAGGRLAHALKTKFLGTPVELPVQWLAGYIPDFGFLNMLAAYTDGMPPLGWSDFSVRILYGCIITFAAVATGAWVFERRNL